MKRFTVIVALALVAILASPLMGGNAEAVYHGGADCGGGCICIDCILFYGCFCSIYGGNCACEGQDVPGGCLLYGTGCGLIIVVSG